MVATDPATEESLTRIDVASEDDVDRAVVAAEEAAVSWARLSWEERGRALRSLGDALELRADEFALLDAADAGIPIRGARRDIANAVRYLRYFADLGSELKGQSLPDPAGFSFTIREPYGVVGRIVPFNHPLQFAAAAIAAPLSAGNAVVLKPSEQTSISALHLAEMAAEILPPGLFNVVSGGANVGNAIVVHPRIHRIGFTGSTRAARTVLAAAAPGIKHVSLELGGKNPLLIMPEVDPGKAADIALTGMNLTRTAGQSCGSTSRIYVSHEMQQPFVEALASRFGALTLGSPFDESTDVGPLAFAAHYERVLHYVASGCDDGARLVVGGDRPPELTRGYYLRPTLFADVRDGMSIANEEIFGPVVSVLSWHDRDELIRRANALPFGLTANIVTERLDLASDLAREVEAGYVWVNGRGERPFGAPFGGYKFSGLGEENSLGELLSYTQQKHVRLASL